MREGWPVIAFFALLILANAAIVIFVESPRGRHIIDNYHKKCGGPTYPPCQ